MDIMQYYLTILPYGIIIYLYQRCYDKDEIIRNLKDKLNYYMD